jgi:hypothetical protein
MAGGEEVRTPFAIGVGARRGVAAEEVVETIENALAAFGLPPLPSPAGGRRWPREAGSDEGSRLHACVDDVSTSLNADPHPTGLRPATFSRVREKDAGGEIAPFIFTIESKKDEAGLCEAALLLGTRIVFLPLDALVARRGDVFTRSLRVEALLGVGSVAEAAALAGAGAGSVLLGPRVAGARVTCAIARNGLEQSP